jgi:hypothetical protein
MGVYDDVIRRAMRRLDRQDQGIKEAIQNCERGNLKPENEWGLVQLLEFARYNPKTADQYRFDSDRIHELEHDHDLRDAEATLLNWISQDSE